jgi:hypothetical protein
VRMMRLAIHPMSPPTISHSMKFITQPPSGMAIFIVPFLAHPHQDWAWIAFSPSEAYRSQAGSQRY